MEAKNSKSANHKESLYFHTRSSPADASNSKSVQFVADNSTVESCSLAISVSVEAKELSIARRRSELCQRSANEDN